MVAGINEHNKILKKDPFVLSRSQAYIGVLIDDLINKGTDEPYRMFTSRAEHRILLRQDNADIRLTRLGYKIGLADKKRIEELQKKEKDIASLEKEIKTEKLIPEKVNKFLCSVGSAKIKEKKTVRALTKRPNVSLNDLLGMAELKKDYKKEVIDQVEINLKYESYIKKETEVVEKIERLENSRIPASFNYSDVASLSAEGKEKLNKIKPKSIGQASRISGVSPSDVSILMVYLKK